MPFSHLDGRTSARRASHLTAMDVSLILKVAGVGLLVTVAHQILSKAGRDEQAMLVTLSGIVIVLLMLVQEIGVLFDTVKAVFGF